MQIISLILFTVLGYKFLLAFHTSFPPQILKHVSLLNTNLAIILDACLSHWNLKPNNCNEQIGINCESLGHVMQGIKNVSICHKNVSVYHKWIYLCNLSFSGSLDNRSRIRISSCSSVSTCRIWSLSGDSCWCSSNHWTDHCQW